MIVKIPVYFEIVNLKGAETDHDLLRDKISEECYEELSGSTYTLQGGFLSLDQTVKAHFRSPSQVHEILRTKV